MVIQSGGFLAIKLYILSSLVWVVYPCPSLMFGFGSMRCIMIGHLVLFALSMEEGMPQCVFSCLLHIGDNTKDVKVIFEALTKCMTEWGLDVGKCIDSGFDTHVVK